MIKRYVAQSPAPKQECLDKEHNHPEVIVHYHIPFVGAISARGTTIEAADKEAQIKSYEALAKLIVELDKKSYEVNKLIMELPKVNQTPSEVPVPAKTFK